MVTAYGCPNQSSACLRRQVADGCLVLHWDVLRLYGLRLPYKPQFSYFFWQAVCMQSSFI